MHIICLGCYSYTSLAQRTDETNVNLQQASWQSRHGGYGVMSFGGIVDAELWLVSQALKSEESG